MKLQEIHDRWLQWNIYGTGKDKYTLGSATGRYRGNVLYYNGEPAARVVKRPHGGWCKLYKWQIGSIPADLKYDCMELYVSHLGVWSRFDDDQISDDDLHTRTQFLMVSEVVEYVNESIDARSDESFERKNAVDVVTRQLDIWNERYKKYSDMFDLRWPDLPDAFWSQARAKAQAKHDRFMDPAAVTKRERSKARRMAMKALGLDKKSA